MTNTITELISNFKEKLMNNYYTRTDEEDNFLKWLETNSNYSNGSYSILEDTNITETEQEDSEKGLTGLKNLVKTWARSKKEKQEYWDNLLKDRISYMNGTVCLDSINTGFTQQTITGEFAHETYYNEKHYYTITINVSPGVTGQIIGYIPEYTSYRTNTSQKGKLIVQITSEELIEDSIIGYAEPVTVDGVLYGGGRITIEPSN